MGKSGRRKKYSRIRRKMKRQRRWLSRKVRYDKAKPYFQAKHNTNYSLSNEAKHNSVFDKESKVFSDTESNPFSDTESNPFSSTESYPLSDAESNPFSSDEDNLTVKTSSQTMNPNIANSPGKSQETSEFVDHFLDTVRKDKLYIGFVKWKKLSRQQQRLSDRLFALENTEPLKKT